MSPAPPLSNRILGISAGGRDGWEILYDARDLQARGVPLIDLTIGEPDHRTDPAILDAMHASARGGHTGYADIPGIPALRDAIAARVTARTGVPTGRANVLVTPGGQAGLFAAHLAALDPGDAALCLDPYYVTYPGTLRAVGARPVVVPTRAEDGFLPDAATLNAAAPGALSLVINTPNNPTGAVYPRATLQAIADTCTAHGLWLISDEVYDTQVWSGTHVSPRALPGMADRTLVIGSLSKSHAMTGSRLGWIVGPEPAIARLESLSLHSTYGVPGYIQDAAVFALAQGSALEDRIAAPFRRRRDAVLDELSGQDLVRPRAADGAMYVMLDMRATGLDGRAFAARLLAEERIALLPGESFGKAAAGHLRLALTRPEAEIRQALRRLLAFAARQSPP